MHVRVTLKHNTNTGLVRNLTTSSFTAGTGHLGNARLSLWEDVGPCQVLGGQVNAGQGHRILCFL